MLWNYFTPKVNNHVYQMFITMFIKWYVCPLSFRLWPCLYLTLKPMSCIRTSIYLYGQQVNYITHWENVHSYIFKTIFSLGNKWWGRVFQLSIKDGGVSQLTINGEISLPNVSWGCPFDWIWGPVVFYHSESTCLSSKCHVTDFLCSNWN